MKQLPLPKSLEPFARDIFLLQRDDTETEKKLPFYADGYAGIIYSRSEHPFYQHPLNKKLSDFYLYGQTIEPITLNVKGAFQLICMRLYPFAMCILLGVHPRELKDDCYDLRRVKNVSAGNTLSRLAHMTNWEDSGEILADYFQQLLQNAAINPDYRIKLAINLILQTNGTMSIQELREKLGVTERTLERHFLKEIGITAKQFARIIQFRSAMTQMTETDYVNLTDVGYDNRFADQSHFIRSFKRYTGKTPREFLQQISR